MLKNQVNEVEFKSITKIVYSDTNSFRSLDQLVNVDVNKLKQINKESVKKVLIFLISNLTQDSDLKYDYTKIASVMMRLGYYITPGCLKN